MWIGLEGAIAHMDGNGQTLGVIRDRNHLGRITALAVRGHTVIAADATKRTIHLIHDGQWQAEIGRDANTRGFMFPNGVLDLALDCDGQSFVVAHPQKHRVERYDLEGHLIDKFGRFGMTAPADFGGCCNPTNIATMAGGMIALSEKAPPRIKLFARDGTFLAQTQDGPFDANTKNIDLASGRGGRLYATDPLRCTLEVFELKNFPRTATVGQASQPVGSFAKRSWPES
jgi:hypothetical protein